MEYSQTEPERESEYPWTGGVILLEAEKIIGLSRLNMLLCLVMYASINTSYVVNLPGFGTLGAYGAWRTALALAVRYCRLLLGMLWAALQTTDGGC